MAASPSGSGGAPGASRDLRLDVQGREQAPAGGQALGEHRLQVGQLAQRLGGHQQGGEEGDEGADVGVAAAGAASRRRRSRAAITSVISSLGRRRGGGAGVGAVDDVALAAGDHLGDAAPPRRPRGSRS